MTARPLDSSGLSRRSTAGWPICRRSPRALRTASAVALLATLGLFSSAPHAQAPAARATYYPSAGEWTRKTPAEVGMDAAKLAAAIKFAEARETNWPRDFSTQEKIFGSLLGPIPAQRAATSGLVIRSGYIVAEFGDTSAVGPTYSVAKSMLATVTGIAVRDGLIKNLDAPVGSQIADGGYRSPQNAQVTWRHHLQQESEWEGEMWGKKHDFVGRAAFGDGERKPRNLQPPGAHYEYNDVRINRFALSLLRLFGKPVPEVFREQVMSVIGASNSWQWIPYTNSYAEVDGRTLASVSGGTRWGGGVWINAVDMARFGYLWLRNGRWESQQIVPPAFVKAALTPSAHGPDYGFLWWLNTRGGAKTLPTNSFQAQGAGSNTIFVSPDHDLVIVWRWHGAGKEDFFRQVIDAIQQPTTNGPA
jgi:CubicO group peptidase (beta-lactamase class C family)